MYPPDSTGARINALRATFAEVYSQLEAFRQNAFSSNLQAGTPRYQVFLQNMYPLKIPILANYQSLQYTMENVTGFDVSCILNS
jgi:hypothetical protein